MAVDLLARLGRLYLSRQFVVFLLCGGAAAVVNLAVGVAIYGTSLGAVVPYALAVVLAALSGIVVNFGLNYLFNFRFRGRSAVHQLQTFAAVAGIGTLLTGLFAWTVDRLLLAARIAMIALPGGRSVSAQFAAHVAAVGLVTFYSYAAHRYFSFSVGFQGRWRALRAAVRDADS